MLSGKPKEVQPPPAPQPETGGRVTRKRDVKGHATVGGWLEEIGGQVKGGDQFQHGGIVDGAEQQTDRVSIGALHMSHDCTDVEQLTRKSR
jgi:hypothetical protein